MWRSYPATSAWRGSSIRPPRRCRTGRDPFASKGESTTARVRSIREATTRIDTNGTRRKVFISYKHAPDDAALAQRITDVLARDHDVFVDTQLRPGDAWPDVIDRELRSSDFLIVLVSAEAAASPEVEEEVAIAHRLHKQYGQPRIIPIRLRFDGALRYSLGAYLNPFQYAFWTGPADSDRVIEEIVKTMARDAVGDPASADVGALRRIAEYRQRVLEQTRYVSLRGIPQPRDRHGRTVDAHVPLDTIYVRIRAISDAHARDIEKAERGVMQRRLTLDGSTEPGRDFLEVVHSLGEYLYERQDLHTGDATSGEAERARRAARLAPIDPTEALRTHGRLVILGPPGSGKTTLLNYIARRAAENADGPIPLQISLREFAMARSATGSNALRDIALSQICGSDWELRRALADRIDARQVLWLLDGLDEARGWAEEAARQASQLTGTLVVTSRPSGYQGAGLESMPHFELLPLSSVDVDRFIDHWFEVVAERQGSANSAELAARFKAQLDRGTFVQTLTRNPLLLTFLAILGGEDASSDLPSRRSDLYRRYVEELMDRWESYRQSSGDGAEHDLAVGPLKGAEARQAALDGFYALGWQLHLAYYGGIDDTKASRRALVAALGQSFETRWQRDAETVAGAVVDHWLRAGILDVWTLGGDEYLTFRHLTFQEYAASHALTAKWQSDAGKTWRFLRPRLHHYAWREPLLLMAGQLHVQQADRLLKLLLSARSRHEGVLQRDLLLAAALVTEATVSSGLRQPIIQRLGRAAGDPRTDIFLKAALSRGWIAAIIASLMGMDDSRRFSLLLLSYLTGLAITIAAVSLGFNGLVAAVVGAAAWSGLWVCAFRVPIFWLRSLLSFPVRIWRRIHDRASAMHLLAQTGDAAAIPFLLEALESRNSAVVDAAARGLGRMGEPAVSRVMRLVEEGREPIRAIAPVVLAQRGRSSAAYVIGLLAAPTPGIRWAASRAVGELGIEQRCQGSSRFCRIPSLIRKAAADALSKMPDPRAVERLMIAAGDENARVASAAAHALGCIGDPGRCRRWFPSSTRPGR